MIEINIFILFFNNNLIKMSLFKNQFFQTNKICDICNQQSFPNNIEYEQIFPSKIIFKCVNSHEKIFSFQSLFKNNKNNNMQINKNINKNNNNISVKFRLEKILNRSEKYIYLFLNLYIIFLFAGIYNIVNYKKNKYDEFIQKYQNEIQQISLEKMFIVNESENCFYQNENYNIKFNCTLHIELSFQENGECEKLDKYSLKDLLYIKYITKKKEIEKKKDYYSEIDKSYKICKLPKILIITISRAEVGEKLKTKKLIIPKEINLSEYIDKDLINKRNFKYKLFAINEKKGNSKSNGHYYCFIKIDDNWYLFDDEYVTKKTPNFTSKNAVGLFYKEFN